MEYVLLAVMGVLVVGMGVLSMVVVRRWDDEDDDD
jgi:Flp pilus assembly protein CpaB